MAIFGVGANWSGDDQSRLFIESGRFILGWNQESANDLYSFISSLKNGDILYMKTNQPGSRKITVKGIGIISKNVIQCIHEGLFSELDSSDWESLFVAVKWIVKEQFEIEIPSDEGRLTNIRAATVYEEYLPFVQEIIINKICGII